MVLVRADDAPQEAMAVLGFLGGMVEVVRARARGNLVVDFIELALHFRVVDSAIPIAVQDVQKFLNLIVAEVGDV